MKKTEEQKSGWFLHDSDENKVRYSISWCDEDHIMITGPYDNALKIAGGDFESFIDALLAMYKVIKSS